MDSPYIGLRPYTTEEQHKFFGRDDDIRVLLESTDTTRLTLLFAASGVGKSSLLRAGLIPALTAQGRNDVVYFRDWAYDAAGELKQAIADVLQANGRLPDGVDLPLAEFVACCAPRCAKGLIVILDQFEEYFHYRKTSDAVQPFLREIAAVVRASDIPATVVISMREDFALELNALKPHLPHLFEHFHRLEKLNPAAARQAIEQPVRNAGFRYEEGLVDTLLEYLSRREQIEREGLNAAMAEQKLRVEPPHLQIICSELWAAEQSNQDKCIRHATYVQKGGTEKILADFFQVRMKTLNAAEQHLAAKAFDLLVNKHGTKMSYPLAELADKLGVAEKPLNVVLDKLAGIWVLRKQVRRVESAPRTGAESTEMLWYELYHDVFARIAYAWNEAHKARLRLRRARRLAVAALAAGGMVFLGYDWAVNHYTRMLYIHPKGGGVELYQGKPDSWDVFQQRDFRGETGFSRQVLEADKRFAAKVAPPLEVLMPELSGALPVTERVGVYLQNGYLQQALDLAEETASSAVSITQLIQQMQIVTQLSASRTVAGTALVASFITPRHHPEMKKMGLEVILQQNFSAQPFLPLLLAQLKDPDRSVRRGAVEVLGALQASQAVPDLIRLLKDDAWQARESAALVLGELQARQAVADLIPLLKDANKNVRQSVATALGKLDAREAIEDLILLLEDSDSDIRQSAIEVLGRLGATQAVADLIPLLKDPSAYVRRSTTEVLSKLREPQTTADLIPLLKDPNPDVRQSAVEILGELQARQAVADLIPLLKDRDESVCQSVMVALSKLQAKQAVADLILLLEDGNAQTRRSAVQVLEQLQAVQAVADLIPRLEDEDAAVRQSTAQALGTLGATQAIADLISLLEDTKDDVRQSAAKALGELDATQAVTDLIRLLGDSDWNVRQSAREALRQLQSPQVVTDLIPLLKDARDTVRENAARVLGERGATQAVADLIPLLKDPRDTVRQTAVEMLGKLRATQAVADLIPLLKDTKGEVRRSAAAVLGELQAGEAVTDLIPLLEDPERNVRQSAAEAAGDLLALEALPRLHVLLDELDPAVSETAAYAFSLIQAVQFAPVLSRALKNPFNTIDYRGGLAALALHKLGSSEGARVLQRIEKKKTKRNRDESDTVPLPADIEGLVEWIQDAEKGIKKRVQALRALGRQATPAAAETVLQLAEQLPAESFGFFIIQALGHTRQPTALPYLREKLAALETAKDQWRALRDKQTLDEAEQAEYARLAPREYFEAEVAHAIAKCDARAGMQLLNHRFYNVRLGAWTGIGFYADAEIVQDLVQAFHATPADAPFKIHALYRAIDTSLITLEVKGGTADLARLEALWQQARIGEDQKTGPARAIPARLEWTVARMRERLEEDPLHRGSGVARPPK